MKRDKKKAMTERFFVGSIDDCNHVREALNVAYGLPRAPTNSSGTPLGTPESRAEKIAQWFALTPEQRDSGVFNGLFPGWTLQATSLTFEWPEGFARVGVWVPGDMHVVLASAAALGRSMTIAQTSTLLAVEASALAAQPADWAVEPLPE